jgi:hypothetical protein
MKSGIFSQGGLDDPNQLESLQQIAVYAHAISEAVRPGERRGLGNNSLICPTGKSAE